MDGAGFWTLAVVAAVFVGLSKGGLPVMAMLSVPLLSLRIEPVAAAGLLLPVYVASDISGLWLYRREFSWPVLKVALVGLLIGIGIGWALAELVPGNVIRVLIGLIGAVFALNLLLRPQQSPAPRPVRWAPGLFWTTIAGFTSFVSHSGGPPWQVWTLRLGLRKMVFAGTSTIAFAYANAVKLIPYGFLGQLGVENLKVAALLVVPATIGVFVGRALTKVLPEKLFFALVTWALLLVSLRLIWTGLTG